MATARTPEREALQRLSLAATERIDLVLMWAGHLLDRLPERERQAVWKAIKAGLGPATYEERRDRAAARDKVGRRGRGP